MLNTDPNAGDLRDNLSYIYGLYVEYVMKNPLYTPGEPFKYAPAPTHNSEGRLVVGTCPNRLSENTLVMPS